MDPVKIPKDPPEEKEKDSPTSPAQTPGPTPPSTAQTPGPTPPPSPHSKKRPHSNSVSTSASRKISKDESSHSRKVSKEEKPVRKSSKEERLSRKLSKEERVSIAAEPPTAAAPSSHVIHQASARPPKTPEPGPTNVPPPQAAALQTGPVNEMGQLHSQYHSYYVKAPSRGPLPPEPEPEEDEEPSQLTLARMAPPPPKSFRNFTLKPTPTGEQSKLRKQDSLKPKSLAETKKASMEMADGQGEENAPNSILVAMVMLLNIGLAIIFVHFLT
nr:junctophilin-1-like [Oncorhynchus nerka]